MEKKQLMVSPARRHFLAAASAAAVRIASIAAVTTTLATPSKAGIPETVFRLLGRPVTRRRGPQCFLKGTRILTSSGEVPVEDLKCGDRLRILSGEFKPVRWVGHRAYTKRGERWRDEVLPIRIRSGTLGPQTPHRDLYLSRWHSLLFDGWLIPAKDLVNGHSIVAVMPDGRPTIDYFHIALDSHEVISAEGVDAESLLIRNGEHEHFSNFVEYDRLGVREAMTPCAPQFCYAGGRSHLAALLRLGISNFVNVRDPIQKVEQKLTALAARSAEYAN